MGDSSVKQQRESNLSINTNVFNKKKSLISIYLDNIKKNWMLYLMIVPGLLYYIIFKYIPLFGSVIAFQDYQIFRGIFDSPWVWLDNFKYIFSYQDFYQVLRNTAIIAFYQLIFGFPAPIILALLFNEIRLMFFKRTVQSLFYLPHFLSWVVVGGIVFELLALEGIVNAIRELFGAAPILLCRKRVIFVQLSSFREYGKVLDGEQSSI